jgi:hypothetical protein
MRIQEIREAINPDILRPEFRKKKMIKVSSGYVSLVATSVLDSDEIFPQFLITAYNALNHKIGYLRFNVRDLTAWKRALGLGGKHPRAFLTAKMVEVDPRYQKQGIAGEMYKFAHELGNDVKPSDTQTPPGRDMWNSFTRNNTLS